MPKNQVINLEAVEKVAKALDELNEEVIYVGGAIIGLYATEEAAEQPRPTKDIDISVQISSYREMNALSERLAKKHIYPAENETVLYRYRYEDILVDFIPYEATALGPTNSWLKPGFEKAYPVIVGETQIRILPVSLFLATKWEAHKNRGGDPRTSHDFEDIIYVLDNNLEVVNDFLNADRPVQAFLQGMADEILNHPHMNEIVECHLNPYAAEGRRKVVVKKLEEVTKNI